MNSIIHIDNEQFKRCPINPIYHVSKDGRIYSEFKRGFLTWSIDHNGYPRVDMYINGKQKHMKVHKIVWITWMGDVPAGYQINHYDDDKLNASLDNLYIGTQKQNIQDCINNNHRVGNVSKLVLFDKKVGKIVEFIPANKFIEYSGHSCNSCSISKMARTKWFKARYNIILHTNVENVTTMTDECRSVG